MPVNELPVPTGLYTVTRSLTVIAAAAAAAARLCWLHSQLHPLPPHNLDPQRAPCTTTRPCCWQPTCTTHASNSG